MFNIGSLMVDSLDYLMIVDREYKIIYSTRYDAILNSKSKEYHSNDIKDMNFFDVYPNLDKEDSSIYKCLETGQIIVKKQQICKDYQDRRYVTNNVTIPLISHGELVAAVEIAMDVDEGSLSGKNANDKFNEFVNKIKMDTGLVSFKTILTVDKDMEEAIERAEVISSFSTPVLIYGETGTGKELFAQAIISASGVPREKVIIQNCAAIPGNLVDSIFFGTTTGLFTGAEKKEGLFEMADGGVLFLDEMNSIPIDVQAKLLRVIQDGSFRPLGSSEDKHVNVKIIAAVNKDPIEAIQNGEFREDLFYRFSSGYIALKPLRERKEDIALLLNHYLEAYNEIYNKNVAGFSDEVKSLFYDYSWDGNVRELKNTVDAMVAGAKDDGLLGLDDLSPYFLNMIERQKSDAQIIADELLADEELAKAVNTDLEQINYIEVVDALEKGIIEKTLKRFGGNRTKAAEYLNLPRQTMNYKIKKLGIYVDKN